MAYLQRLTPLGLWRSYVRQLQIRPITTKTATSISLFTVGDLIAQLGFESRVVDVEVMQRSIGLHPQKDVKGKGKKLAESSRKPEEDLEFTRYFDLPRMLRMTAYGMAFGPVAHTWFGIASRINLSTKLRTSLARVAIEATTWSPFVCAFFPTFIGLAEGKSIQQVKEKLQTVWYPTWSRAIFVFGPAQFINFNFVPPTYQILLFQSVVLCWNVYLSWLNNRANQIAHLDTSLETSSLPQSAVRMAQLSSDSLKAVP